MANEQVDVNKDAISCPICTDILHKALETHCGHAFCELCIRKWLDTHTTCPMCKKNPHPVHPSFTLRSICEQYYKKHPDQIELMTREKELGNDYYSKKQYWKAIEHYTAAMSRLEGEANDKLGILYNNRSQCYIKLFKYNNALADCEKAICMTTTTDNQGKATKLHPTPISSFRH
jgi:tetratricopeptide (TPR) repeat protein